ncbi:hypothetical protein [Bacillus taeanensis]|uniref:DUF1878 domain-containing protein n=1 Tax=Bacillus taeanensis TaxID=273032 RepID=A0A366XTV8_9BACI|nr:hypothetical protein [Bacillus taeanensis]RBW69800.1 hypothetical protein DS031_09725 [Bacillus taeanensis]
MKSEQLNKIIEKVVEGIYKDYPEILERFGERGKQKCFEDNEHHFRHLETALNMNNNQFFIDYALWLNNVLTSRGMKTEHLIDNFKRIDQVLLAETDFCNKESYQSMLSEAIEELYNIELI